MKIFLAVVVVLIIGVGAYFLFFNHGPSGAVTPPAETASTTPPTSTAPSADGSVTLLGKSVQGKDINAYHFGTGTAEVLFIGGIHGGYEWNTVLEANQLMTYLSAHPEAVPANEKVTVIPVLNPDGLAKVVSADASGKFAASDVTVSLTDSIPGRFNANNVDLNRNFDCDWQATGQWQSRTVSGGSAAFSEPETQALKAYVETNKPTAVVVWFSAAGGVYGSSCGTVAMLPSTKSLLSAYGVASGYPQHTSFDVYTTSGDLANWLSRLNVPAISVLLTNHTDTEWDKNWKGVQAVLTHYAK